MKKRFIFLVMLFALLGGVNWNVLNAQDVIEIGNGTIEKYGLPVYEAGTPGGAFASVSQQIYLEDEIGVGEAMITSISFQLIAGNNNTRNIAVYMQNTEKSAYTGNYDMINVSESDIVYDGEFTFAKANDWVTIEFENPFEYTGNNIALTVYDKTGTALGYVYENIDRAYCHSVTDWRGMLYTKTNTTTLDMTNLSGYYASRTYVNSDNVVNNIKLTYMPSEANIRVSENSVDLGNVRLGSYWSEKETVSYNIEARAIGTTITNISCDNDFFELKYDLNTKPVVINVSYDKNARVNGVQNGNVTITSVDCEPVVITVTANPYTPAQGDIWENPIAVTFTDNIFTDAPTGIYDDYKLPGEVTEGSTPDAVYNFTMGEGTLTVNVEGTNATAAIYKAEDLVGNGPSLENNYGGILPEPTLQEMEIHIKGETTSTSKYIPYYEYYENSISQQIYTADEMQVAEGVITSIAFQKGNATAYDRTLEIYLYNTDKQSFTGAQDWVNMSNENLVFSGDVIVPSVTGDWLYIELDTPFEYEGENLLLCVNDKTGSWKGSQSSFNTYSTNQNRTIFYYRDGTPYDATNITISGSLLADVNVVKFNGTFASKSRSLVRSTEPQINGVQYPAGEYYLVAAAEGAFTVSIETASLPAPEAITEMLPADEAMEQDNPKLQWTLGQYTSEYQLLLGTTNPPTTVAVDWTSELASSFQTADLEKNTRYYWQVKAKNSIGETATRVYSFVTPLDVPQNVTAANIFEGETATVTWNAIENVTYNVYVDGTKVNAEPITATSYELTDLAYNLSGYNVTVTANHTLGESPMSAAVNVKVGGKFTFVLNVKDTEDNAIEGATVTFNTESFLNEFYQGIPAIEATTTDAEGKVSVELPLPCKYEYPSYQFSSFGAIVTKEFYSENDAWIDSYTTIEQGEYVAEVILELAAPAALTAEDDELLVGEDLELSWDEVTGAIGYNVYKQGEYNDVTSSYDYVKLNDEMITATAYTVEDVEYGMWVEYAVTAVYAIGESGYTTTPVSVTGMGSVSGTVTDGANPVKGVKVVLTGKDAFNNDTTYTYTTDASGQFAGVVMVGSYTATATRYDFEDYTSNEQVVVNYNETASVNIAMTTYPSATINNVEATEAGDNAVVNWTAEYEKYNVYRMNVATEDVVGPLATITEETYTDDWATLENGTYRYGVSAFVDGGNINAFEEDFQNNGWNIPDGWDNIPCYYTSYGWEMSQYWSANNGDTYFYSPVSNKSATLNTPIIDLSNSKAATLSFDYKNTPYDNSYGVNTLYVKIKAEGESTTITTISDNVQNFTKCELTLDNNYIGKEIQISFEVYTQAYSTTTIDNIVVSSESTIPTTITWSNAVVKIGALTFNNAAGDNNWNNPDNWVGGVLPTAENNVVVNAEANITGTVAVNNLTINARLNVMPEAAFTVNGTITDANEYGNLYIEDGAQIFQKNEGVNAYFRMNIINPEEWSSDNKEGWQFISSPLLRAEVTAAATKYDNAYQLKDYDMYKYNGSLENEWVNHKANYDFEAYFTEGRGYMYSHQARTIVTLGGTLNPATTFDYEVSYNGEENPLANLHLLGNPFTFDMDWQYVNVSNVYDGYATLNAAGDDYVYATEGTIAVGDGFFVQAIGENPEIGYPKNVRGSKETSANINVIARGNAGEDNVIINFAGEGEGFRKLQGFNEDNARIFVENEGKRYGIANVEANATEVELSFVAAQMGNYTISLDVNGKFETVVLVDRFTGVETNMLLEDEYSFTATSNDSPNRFVVRLGGAKTESASFVYQSGEELILSIEGSVQIVDMLGRVVYSNEHASGDNRIYVGEFNDATYVVRVVNEEGVKTQKVVIY